MATQGVPLWSTTAATNSTADPAVNWAEGQAPSSVNDSARAMMASLAKWRDDLYGLTTGGTSTAFTVTTNATYATAALMSGAVFTIIPNATSGATPTLAVDGLTARALNVSTGVAIPTGALKSGTPYLIKYVHATTEFIVLGVLDKTLLAAIDIIGGTSFTDLATGDTLPAYDVSATANKRILVSDFLKIVNALTEDTSPDSANDFLLSYDASASAAKKVKPQSLPVVLPRGYIDGCILSNNVADATNDIDVAAGVCRDSSNVLNITVAAMTKQLDANWAPGSGAGMRNSAAGIANTTYHIYAVAKADGTQDIYAHTSTTVATVITALQAESGGASYLYARHIGSIIRASAAILTFTQYGDEFSWNSIAAADVSNATPGTSANTATLNVPAGIVVLAFVTSRIADATGAIYISPLTAADVAPSVTGAPLGHGSNGVSASRVWTNTSGQIRYRCSSNNATYIVTHGYQHPRGKNA